MDEAFWESFEPIFTEWSRGGIKYGLALAKIKRKIEAEGYRCIEEGEGKHFEKVSGQILWDKIQEAFAEGGSVFYCRTNLVDGEFVWIKKIEDLVEGLFTDIEKIKFEMQKTEYFDGEHEDTYSTDFTIQRDNEAQFDPLPTIEHEDTVIRNLGLDNRSNMEEVDGEQTWVSKIMFNRYHGSFQKMWFINSVIIPQPFNMSWPKWLVTAIKKALTKQKL